MKKIILLSIAFLSAIASVNAQGLKIAQVNPAEKQIVIQNFGNMTVDVSSYQFCSLFNYAALSSGAVIVDSGSLNLSAGASVTLTWNSPGAMNMNGSDLCLYQPSPVFTNPDHMIDFVQWNSAGNGRESVAVAAGLWATGTFIDGNSPMSYIGDGIQSGVQFWALDCIDPALIGSIDICPSVYAPVCGCNDVTYDNDCLAQTIGGVTSWTEGVCSAVEPGDCPELEPGLDFGLCAAVVGVALLNNECVTISGCGTVASNGLDYEAYFYASPSDCEACLEPDDDCIDPDQIDPEMGCFDIYEPVCGCDSVTYSNDCYAFYYGGVTSWTVGECNSMSEPCDDMSEVDFGECDFPLGITIINGTCQGISGCDYVVDGIDYSPSFFDTAEECEECLGSEECINPDQIDESMICIEIYDPVCGCDTVTYQNECYAYYYGGVTSWTAGECASTSESCDDLGDIDFGECEMAMGFAVVNGMCEFISGCGFVVDGVDYTPSFYETIGECKECLEPEECVNPDQIDLEWPCTEEYNPVCGCDSITYSNDCYAFYYGGVTSWTEGECSSSAEPCDDLSEIDFGPCDMLLGVAIINGNCTSVSGCGYMVDGLDYSGAFFDSFGECDSTCFGTGCINPDQIDSTQVCIEIYDPVCGCDGVTYDNDCYAFYYGGVTSWTAGECIPVGVVEQSPSFIIEPRAGFQLFINSNVLIESLLIYDLTGKIVTQFGTIAPGEHLLELPQHSTGIYIYHAHSKNDVESGKLFVR